MAAKKKKKSKKPVKAKKKVPARKAKKKAKKPTKKASKKKASKKKTSRKTPARKAAKKKAVKKKKKQIVGEGDYQASRAFLKDQSGFVKKNRASIPAMGKDAERALEGPEGDALREAEATAAARSRDLF